MNQFIEACRREWKRLRVPEPIADEMAAELQADLEEAEAEGISREGVLGSDALDPRSFAVAWAAERGVIPPPRRPRFRRRLLQAAVATLTSIAAVGAGLVVFASPEVSARMASVSPPLVTRPVVTVSYDRRGQAIARAAEARAQIAANRAIWVALSAAPPSTASQPAGVEIHRVGSILLIVGIVGSILAMLLLLWPSSRRVDAARA